MTIDWKRNYIEQLSQLTTVTWDGDLICKTDRSKLVEAGLAHRWEGLNWISEEGIKVLHSLGIFKY